MFSDYSAELYSHRIGNRELGGGKQAPGVHRGRVGRFKGHGKILPTGTFIRQVMVSQSAHPLQRHSSLSPFGEASYGHLPGFTWTLGTSIVCPLACAQAPAPQTLCPTALRRIRELRLSLGALSSPPPQMDCRGTRHPLPSWQLRTRHPSSGVRERHFKAPGPAHHKHSISPAFWLIFLNA